MNIENIKKNAEHSGKCGQEIYYWRLGNELYIEGQGAIESCSFVGDDFSSVVISQGCTEIGDCAFGCNSSLKSVELPDSLEKICYDAFRECTSLVLTIPCSVTEILNDAFLYVEHVTYDGPARPESDNDNWGAEKWSWDPSLRPRILAFRCGICGSLNDKPLNIHHKESFEGAVIAAYLRGVNWDNQIPVPGTEMEIIVRFPFCCAVGDEFWSAYKNNQFVQSKLLSVLESNEKSAKVRVLILKTGNEFSFLKSVDKDVKIKYKENHGYDYVPPCGDALNPSVWGSTDRILRLSNNFGGGDINYYDYIYTDDEGIDHLVMSIFDDAEESIAFVGDAILGYQTDSPFQWENDLFIDRKNKTVISCKKDAKEIVVPDGIVRLGWWSFHTCINLERLTVPDSVVGALYAFPISGSNIKEIILTGNSVLSEKDLPSDAVIIRKP